MRKRTSSFGKRHNTKHTGCHCCGSKAYRLQKATCSICGYPAKPKRKHGSPEEQHPNPRGQLLQHLVHLEDFNN
uniref:Large ribosomal subunit protein eL37 n=1 Tax=Equus asinus TaxID=9793 RepID=A0A8C4MKX8_EQUAS